MLTIIIPIYSVNDQLDICLLSILGQVQLQQVEVVCVPLANIDSQATLRLTAWHKRDARVTIPCTTPVPTLYDAYRTGIASSKGDYIMFMNQTDMISSPHDLSDAYTTAQQRNVQVLLTAEEQRTDTDAYSPSITITPRRDLLPESITLSLLPSFPLSLFLLTPPLVYGNIYQREYMAGLFQYPHVFANAADLAVSQIALLHAERVSHTDIATIRSRYEAFPLPLLTSQELSMTQETLIRQITVKLATNHAETIVGSIMIAFVSYLLASYHPYSSFVRAAEHYRPLCQQLTDPVTSDVPSHLFRCQRYLSAIARSIPSDTPDTPGTLDTSDTPDTPDTPDTLIEAYTFPSRIPLFVK